MTHATALVGSALFLVLLVALVGMRLLFCRVQEMRHKRIDPQAAATSLQMAARLEDVQAADNFRNLFEVPVLLYTLVALAVAASHTPQWLVVGAWLFVALRAIHSWIHCTYNQVMHRLTVFLASFSLVIGLWVAFFVTLPPGAG